MFGSRITHAIAGEATTTRMGLQKTDVSVYNTVTRTSYGYYRRAELLETHVRKLIARDRSVKTRRGERTCPQDVRIQVNSVRELSSDDWQ